MMLRTVALNAEAVALDERRDPTGVAVATYSSMTARRIDWDRGSSEPAVRTRRATVLASVSRWELALCVASANASSHRSSPGLPSVNARGPATADGVAESTRCGPYDLVGSRHRTRMGSGGTS